MTAEDLNWPDLPLVNVPEPAGTKGPWDREAYACVSSGQCVLITSAVFDQDDDGLVVLLDASPAKAQQEKVREAAHVCPTSAITFSE
jgi:ferredoxin